VGVKLPGPLGGMLSGLWRTSACPPVLGRAVVSSVVWVAWVLSSSAMIVSSVVACGSGDSVGEVVACSVEPEGVLLAPCWPHPNEETSTTAAVIAAKMADRYHLGTILRYSPECVEGEFCEVELPFYGVLRSSASKLRFSPTTLQMTQVDCEVDQPVSGHRLPRRIR
jgi:hypothetical protein